MKLVPKLIKLFCCLICLPMKMIILRSVKKVFLKKKCQVLQHLMNYQVLPNIDFKLIKTHIAFFFNYNIFRKKDFKE